MFHVYTDQSGRLQSAVWATYRHQLKVLEVLVATVARACKGLLDAQSSGADAVGYVDDARQFLELEEELARDGVIAGQQRSLGRGPKTVADEDQQTKDEAGEGGHRVPLTCSRARTGVGGEE